MSNKMSNTSMEMSLLEILKESLKLPFRNAKLIISISLLFLIPSSLIFFANDVAIKPFIMDFLFKAYAARDLYPDSPEYAELLNGIKKDVRILVTEETIFILASSALSFFSVVAMIYASAVVYCWKNLTPKELLVTIGRIWRRPAITWSYVAIINLGYVLIGAILIGVLLLAISMESVPLICLGCVMFFMFIFMYIYLAMVWKLGLVVSVLEEGCHGMGAIWKAGELIKGRKSIGFFLSLILTLVGLMISGFFGYQMGGLVKREATRLVLGIILINATCIEELFSTVVYTIFYCECKKWHGEKVELEEAAASGYSLV